MTREVVIVIRDDFDREVGADTYTFSWRGTSYEIDLGPENFRTFERVMGPYLSVARRAEDDEPRRSATQPNPYQRYKDRKAHLDRVRAWGNKNGHPIHTKGQLPRVLVQAYNDANPHDQIERR